MNTKVTAGIVMTGLIVAAAGSVYAMGSKPHEHPAGTAASQEQPMAKQDMQNKMHAKMMSKSVYVCPTCDSMALKAGKCKGCGKDMQKMHLLSVKDGKATVCACAGDCKCDAKGVKDGKCACGKEVKTVSCKGMYCCPMGCPVMSKKEGKCPGCGMELKKAE